MSCTMSTPWGPSQGVKDLEYAQDERGNPFAVVTQVHTAGHGGIGVLEEVAHLLLTPEAIAEGFVDGAWRWYEEDCDATIILYERQAARARAFNDRKEGDPYKEEAFLMASLLKSLTMWHANYLKARGIEPTKATA